MSKEKKDPNNPIDLPDWAPQNEKEDSQVVPDYEKNITGLIFNSSYVSAFQSMLMYILSTVDNAEQITKAYAKINTLEEATEEKPYKGETFTQFEESLWILLNVISYLRTEMIKQKAFHYAEIDISKDDIAESLQKLIAGDPSKFNENHKEVTEKILKSITIAESK